jgi:hypothetical protein
MGRSAQACPLHSTTSKIISLPLFPLPQTCAYNHRVSVAGVFRETFAGRRRPALALEP